MPYHVSRKQFEKLVEQALADLPAEFAEIVEEVRVEVLDRPHSRMVDEHGPGILGLYEGIPMIDESVMHSGTMPGVIYIFREPLEAMCNSEDELIDEVRITVLHEIGHHFGLDEDDLDELGYG